MNIVNEITNLQKSSGGNLSNYYTKTESDNLLNAKQTTISDRGGTGPVPLVNVISCLFAKLFAFFISLRVISLHVS